MPVQHLQLVLYLLYNLEKGILEANACMNETNVRAESWQHAHVSKLASLIKHTVCSLLYETRVWLALCSHAVVTPYN